MTTEALVGLSVCLSADFASNRKTRRAVGVRAAKRASPAGRGRTDGRTREGIMLASDRPHGALLAFPQDASVVCLVVKRRMLHHRDLSRCSHRHTTTANSPHCAVTVFCSPITYLLSCICRARLCVAVTALGCAFAHCAQPLPHPRGTALVKEACFLLGRRTNERWMWLA